MLHLDARIRSISSRVHGGGGVGSSPSRPQRQQHRVREVLRLDSRASTVSASLIFLAYANSCTSYCLASSVLEGLDALSPSHTILLWLVQSVIILGFTRALSILGGRLKQPQVVFEIIGGILLGPSALGRDGFFATRIFPSSSLGYLGIVADVGLILYLFLVGLELDPRLLASHARKVGAVALFGMIVPFLLGMAICSTLFHYLMASDPEFKDVSFTSFFVFIGTSMAITAFPVLARILKEGGLIYTRAGTMAMGAAALNDAVAWCLLILAISVANAGSMNLAGYVFATVVGVALFLFFVLRPIFERLVTYVESLRDPHMDSNLFGLTIMLVFVCAYTTGILGVHTIFGPFLFGLIVPRDSKLFHKCDEAISAFVLTITLPLYFTLSGLKTDITQIDTKEAGAMLVLVCFVATVGKLIGAGLPCALSGMSVRDTSVVAILMNTRGLVELIVLNLGVSSGILNTKIFTVMVLMAVFTTFLTCPILNLIYPIEMRRLENKEVEEDTGGGPEDDVASEVRSVASTSSADLGKIEMSLFKASSFGEDVAGEANEERRSLSVNAGVVMFSVEKTTEIMDFIRVIAPTSGNQNHFSIMRCVEPTFSEKDKFLGLTNEHVISITEEVVSMIDYATYHSTRGKVNMKMLPLGMFCCASGASVSCRKIIGDPHEFAGAIGDISSKESNEFLIFSWAPHDFVGSMFWRCVRRSSVPVALLARTPAVRGAQSDVAQRSGGVNVVYSPCVIRKVGVVINGGPCDMLATALAAVVSEKQEVEVVVFLPADHERYGEHSQQAIKYIRSIHKTNVMIMDVAAIGQDHGDFIQHLGMFALDLLIFNYKHDWTLGDDNNGSSSPRSRSHSRNRSGTVIAKEFQAQTGMQFAEFGLFGNMCYNECVAPYLLVLHANWEAKSASNTDVLDPTQAALTAAAPTGHDKALEINDSEV